VVEDDRERLEDVLAARDRARGTRGARGARGTGGSATWADSVAGNMDRHYSPGRTWEATAWALLGLASVGDVLDVASGDGVIAALLAPRARSVTCIDRSAKVIGAARERLRACRNVRFEQADMHALPFADASFDAAVLMHALTFARDPDLVLAELARVLKPGGALVAATLKRHAFRSEVESYDHLWTGFDPKRLATLLEKNGFAADLCEVTSQERRRPHFEVITIHARRLARRPARGST
jgi:ArsR family transcriptional regulator